MKWPWKKRKTAGVSNLVGSGGGGGGYMISHTIRGGGVTYTIIGAGGGGGGSSGPWDEFLKEVAKAQEKEAK